MTYQEYLARIDDAKNQPLDLLIAENVLNLNDGLKAIQAAEIIKAASDGDIQKLIKQSGQTGYAFARNYSIPIRTVQSWASGSRKAPAYLAELLGYAMLGSML